MVKNTLLGASLVALALAGSNPARAELELTLNFPVAVGGPITAIIDEYAKAYSDETEGVTVVPVYTGSYQDTITRTMTAFRGGNPPDMAVLLAVDTFSLYDEDMIVAISELAQTEEEKAWLASFYPAFLENGNVAGSSGACRSSARPRCSTGTRRPSPPPGSTPRCRPRPGRSRSSSASS
jgi:sn-glycerol 3-phosphate transport system substrate-binding protein